MKDESEMMKQKFSQPAQFRMFPRPISTSKSLPRRAALAKITA
jgi:hypothetical protein